MKKIVCYLLFILVSLTALLFALNWALGLPEVKFSYETQECVEVLVKDERQYNCENLPKRYIHVWVE